MEILSATKSSSLSISCAMWTPLRLFEEVVRASLVLDDGREIHDLAFWLPKTAPRIRCDLGNGI